MRSPSHADADLIGKLYDLRREARMRQARAWFVANFKVKTFENFQKLCPAGSDENAFARQVITYWDMAASFLNAGVLHEELFLQSRRELILVWERVKPFLAQMRAAQRDPLRWSQLEQAAGRGIELMRRRGPDAYEALAARIRG
jgi:hypothetical protein